MHKTKRVSAVAASLLMALSMTSVANAAVISSNAKGGPGVNLQQKAGASASGAVGPGGSGSGANLGKSNGANNTNNSTNINNTSDAVSMHEYTLSQNSKYRPYLWKDAAGNAPEYKAYVFEPKNFNGHTVFLDAGHGLGNSAIETVKSEKSYPMSDAQVLAGMKTTSVGSKGFGIGVQSRDTPDAYSHSETEPQFTVRLAVKAKDKLVAKGYRVVMGRIEENQNLSNGTRGAIASETSDIMISLHSNSSASGKVSGTVSFYPGDYDYMSGATLSGYTKTLGLTQTQPASKRLAEIMGSSISSSVGIPNIGANSARLRIFGYSSIPTTLVEVGFADNVGDAKKLIENKDELAQGIVNGVDQYFNN